MINKNYYGIIIAGGIGSRFYPISTEEKPKQFLDILGQGETLLQATYKRLKKILLPQNIYILTQKKYNTLVKEQLENIVEEQIICEPAMRNTAPCILYATMKIEKNNPDAQIIITPSDHSIEGEKNFFAVINEAFEYSQKQSEIITLGIVPTSAHTGYGYIEIGEEIDGKIYKGLSFREKPQLEQANVFFQSKKYLWNAGIFICSAKTIIANYEKYQPKMFSILQKGKKYFNSPEESHFIEKEYPKTENISIDYAIMEKAEKVVVFKSNFIWDDLGSWNSLYNKLKKDKNENVIDRNSFLIDSKRNIVKSTNPNKQIIIEGLNDYIVVDDENTLMIKPKKNDQKMKEMIQKTREYFRKNNNKNE